VSADREVTITVSENDLRLGLSDLTARTKTAHDARLRVLALIPEPEWEPTEEQIQATHEIIYKGAPFQSGRSYCTSLLKDMHEAGLL